MKVGKIQLVLIAIFILQGCSYYKTMEMSAVSSPGQQTGYKETISSQKKHFVSMAPYREENPAKGNTSFILFVKNCSEESIDISIQNVTAQFFGSSKNLESRNIPVLSRDELDELIGQLSGFKNPNLRLTADELEGNGYINRLINQQKIMVSELVLHPQVLQPGGSGGGLVVLDTRDMNYKIEGKFHVVVSVDGEQHEFVFSRNRNRQP